MSNMFSAQGQLILSHVQNCLLVQSTRALICFGNWSLLGYVKDKDITAVTVLLEIARDEEELEDGWDSING